MLVLSNEVEKLKEDYGDNFANGSGYNWAYKLLKSEKDKITFKRLEDNIDFDTMRPFYKSASNNIHTGSSSLYFHRGLHGEEADKILMGPSSYGVETPCDLASHCICITTSNLLLTTTQTLEQQIQGLLLSKIREDLKESLSQIELKVDV